MFNELTTESYRIPWLIWIQLIVLILLFALFYFFIVDDDDAIVSALPETSSAASAKGFLFEEIQQIDKPLITNHNDSFAPLSTNRQHQIALEQGGQNRSIKGEIGRCSSMKSGEIVEAGESSTKLGFHPCHYFQSVTVAFLKCFGFDSTSDETSSNRKRRKRKES